MPSGAVYGRPSSGVSGSTITPFDGVQNESPPAGAELRTQPRERRRLVETAGAGEAAAGVAEREFEVEGTEDDREALELRVGRPWLRHRPLLEAADASRAAAARVSLMVLVKNISRYQLFRAFVGKRRSSDHLGFIFKRFGGEVQSRPTPCRAISFLPSSRFYP